MVFRLEQLWQTGSAVAAPGLQSTSSIVVAHGLSCSTACGIFPEQGSNLCLLHWQADSLPLSHQGSFSLMLIIHKVVPPKSFIKMRNPMGKYLNRPFLEEQQQRSRRRENSLWLLSWDSHPFLPLDVFYLPSSSHAIKLKLELTPSVLLILRPLGSD